MRRTQTELFLKAPAIACLAFSGCLITLPSKSCADSIPGLYGTGTLNTGSQAPDSSADLHFSIVSSPEGPGTAYTISFLDASTADWDHYSRSSKWICPTNTLSV